MFSKNKMLEKTKAKIRYGIVEYLHQKKDINNKMIT